MVQEQGEGYLLKPEQQQKRNLGRRDQEIGRFHQAIRKLRVAVPLGFAQTEAGGKLMEALQGAEDSLTGSRRGIRGEVSPLTKEQVAQ